MNLYNKLAIVIFSAILSSLTLISFIGVQMKIDTFWRQKFKPDFLMFPASQVIITQKELEEVHLLYNYLALFTGFFAMFFTLFISELIELYRAYRQQDLVSQAS